MIKSFVASLLLFVAALSANAKAVAYTELNQGRTVIVLHDEARQCPTGFLYAAVRYAKRPLNACWRLFQTPSGTLVHIKDEEGDEGYLPSSVFRDVKEV